jgi:hypothetical protein
VNYVLSDGVGRYLARPWEPGLRAAAEREAYLRHHFEAVFGPRAAGWTIVLDSESDDATRVAAAVDPALLVSLRAAAARARLAVASVQPLAVAAFNRLRRLLRGAGYFLAVRERGRLAVLLVAQGAVRRVASRRSGGDPARELATLLAVEALDAGIARDSALPVYVADWEGAELALAPARPLGALLADSPVALAA